MTAPRRASAAGSAPRADSRAASAGRLRRCGVEPVRRDELLAANVFPRGAHLGELLAGLRRCLPRIDVCGEKEEPAAGLARLGRGVPEDDRVVQLEERPREMLPLLVARRVARVEEGLGRLDLCA